MTYRTRTTDTQWRHKSKISEKLGQCGRQNMLPPYLKIWEWEWIFGRAVKAISSLGVRSPCCKPFHLSKFHYNFCDFEYYTRKEIYLCIVFLPFYSFGIARKLCDEQWLQFSEIDRSVAKSELGDLINKNLVTRLG